MAGCVAGWVEAWMVVGMGYQFVVRLPAVSSMMMIMTMMLINSDLHK